MGDIFGALLLCLPVSGERRAFSLGFFPSKWCSFVLAPLWSYYTSSRALFGFRLGGRLCVGLGLLLGRPGLDGPSWARWSFSIFLGRPFCVHSGRLDSAQTHKNKWF